MVNFIKTRPRKARLLSAVHEEMGAVWFHGEERRLWCKSLSSERKWRCFWRRNTGMFSDDFPMKLNELNLQLQGRDKYLLHLAGKISALTKKPEMCSRWLDEGIVDSFENLSEFAKNSDLGLAQWSQALESPPLHWEQFLLLEILPKQQSSEWQGERSTFCSCTCWFCFCSKRPAHPHDLWLRPQAEVCSTNTEWTLLWCGETASTHRTDSCGCYGPEGEK